MDNVLLIVEADSPLLRSDGPGHRPAHVVRHRSEPHWREEPWEPEGSTPARYWEVAIPLIWQGKPIPSAIHAVADAGERAEAALGAFESYELQADRFYRATGMMAPGKDAPSAWGGPSREERMEAWGKWAATSGAIHPWDRLRRLALSSNAQPLADDAEKVGIGRAG